MILYLSILIWIFNYFSSIRKNNLKIMPMIKNGRTLMERQLGPEISKTIIFRDVQKHLPRWLNYIERELFNQIDKLHENFTADGIRNFIDWMHNKSLHITAILNRSPDPSDKQFLRKTLESWEKLTSSILESSIEAYIDKYMLHNNGSEGALPNTSFTSSDNSSRVTTLPTTLLPTNSSIPLTTSSHNQEATSSATPVSSTEHYTYNNGTNSTISIEQNVTASPEISLETVTTPTSNVLPSLPSESGGMSSAVCTGFLCGPTIAAFSVPLVLLGCVLCFVLLYKHTPLGSLLGRDNKKKEKGKKRLREMAKHNIENSPETLEETKAKRSRLDKFLRAFGYDKNFPYIDEETGKENI
ncbi:PIR-like protein [Plasmodium gallinaceum]|uniref:PIR-like protein n=1 Tax=Plasmodium gallinaceum TaxID=5849 RepID=A0A1J1GQK9_PLAGA|nr:PIR-like protein [Plasmodium gallinaceum]CRG94548.1 PIR-like protein [Plasmodium gallinaceum]